MGQKVVKEIPPKRRYSPWAERLQICLDNPGRPCEVWEAESNEQAENAVDNLNRRRVVMPHKDHVWTFASRGPLVFAIYKGRGGRTRAKSVRRA